MDAGNRASDHESARPTPARRASRFWLLAPFVLVGLVVVAWSAAWFLIRDRVAQELDDALGAQAALGRTWTCADRSIAGFPFRIEIACAALRLRAEDGLALDLGPARAVAQVYQPRHVIVSAGGPFLVETRDGALSGDWALMEASIRNLGRGTEQLAIVVDAPRATIDAPGLPTTVDAQAERVELYARPSPGSTVRDGALDLVVRADAVTIPALDRAVESAAPADVEAQLRATGLLALAAGRGGDPERAARAWREAGGRLDIQLVAVETADAALELTGELGLDDLYRPEGRIAASGRGLGPIAEEVLGGRGGFVADAIVAALGGPAQAQGGDDAGALRPLPPVRLEGGRVYVGPFPVPQVTLEPVI
ncbi:DUF2125 domain-containing protein [Salinarimonas sp.]|uniref:DUF2125 domain-containing protein n=1 Tax=Salinarimonas sp. TaxID=2766526 RepID=UPI0032D996A7